MSGQKLRSYHIWVMLKICLAPIKRLESGSYPTKSKFSPLNQTLIRLKRRYWRFKTIEIQQFLVTTFEDNICGIIWSVTNALVECASFIMFIDELIVQHIVPKMWRLNVVTIALLEISSISLLSMQYTFIKGVIFGPWRACMIALLWIDIQLARWMGDDSSRCQTSKID